MPLKYRCPNFLQDCYYMETLHITITGIKIMNTSHITITLWLTSTPGVLAKRWLWELMHTRITLLFVNNSILPKRLEDLGMREELNVSCFWVCRYEQRKNLLRQSRLPRRRKTVFASLRLSSTRMTPARSCLNGAHVLPMPTADHLILSN